MSKSEKENIDMLAYEKGYTSQGFKMICGVDEAGRGPLAGPVCAAAVIFPEGLIIDGVNDSKKLSEKKREKLFDKIKEEALSYSIAYASVEEIEKLNILNAAMLAMKRAVEGLDIEPDMILVDGNKEPDIEDIDCTAIIKGDALSHSIAAASILAKVSRDRLMNEMAKKYPEYGFDKHKGYGTKLHREKILEYGICEIHRPSFLKKILGDNDDKIQ
ncbi:MAG: ribonuclease HII [Clostridia bacterium]|nr:ribonuclease HII [Clostridia bacterium]